MKFKLAALPLMVFAASASAETYQSISNADYSNTEYDNFDADLDQLRVGTSYYFAPLETRGPLKEFDYIIKSSRLSANYRYMDGEGSDTDILGVGGEYFAANGFVVGASYADADGSDANSLSAGYLFTPNFLAKVRREKFDGADAVYFADLRYNHELGGNDYIGFNFVTDDEFDARTLSSKLLKELPGQAWLALKGSYTSVDEGGYGLSLADVWELDAGDSVGRDHWNLGAEYYFSKESSVNVGYNKAETFEVGASHFFSRNVAGKLSYATNSDIDVDTFLLGLTVQL